MNVCWPKCIVTFESNIYASLTVSTVAAVDTVRNVYVVATSHILGDAYVLLWNVPVYFHVFTRLSIPIFHQQLCTVFWKLISTRTIKQNFPIRLHFIHFLH